MAAWTMVAAALAAAAAEPPTEQTHPHLEDMIQRVFPTNDATIQAEKEMDEYFGDGLRAGVVFLLKDLRDASGQPYRQNKKWGK